MSRAEDCVIGGPVHTFAANSRKGKSLNVRQILRLRSKASDVRRPEIFYEIRDKYKTES